MRRSIMLASAASLAIALSGPAYSQGAPQTVTLMKVDPQTLATGYRTSKVVGATVVNEANETVGTIDDLIVTPGGQTPYAVLSVGGFLGIGTKVRRSALHESEDCREKNGSARRHQRCSGGPPRI